MFFTRNNWSACLSFVLQILMKVNRSSWVLVLVISYHIGTNLWRHLQKIQERRVEMERSWTSIGQRIRTEFAHYNQVNSFKGKLFQINGK